MGKNDTGRLGELAAARYLRDKGYQICGANYKTRLGEIDIIASTGRFLAFIEVKTRAEDSMLLPREAVDRRKQEKIIKTAMLYLSGNPSNLQPRFDVVEVIIKKSKDFRVLSINHIENAFS